MFAVAVAVVTVTVVARGWPGGYCLTPFATSMSRRDGGLVGGKLKSESRPSSVS